MQNAEFTELILLAKLGARLTNSENAGKVGVMMAVIGILLWALFRFVLPIVLLIVIGTVVNGKYYHRSVI